MYPSKQVICHLNKFLLKQWKRFFASLFFKAIPINIIWWTNVYEHFPVMDRFHAGDRVEDCTIFDVHHCTRTDPIFLWKQNITTAVITSVHTNI